MIRYIIIVIIIFLFFIIFGEWLVKKHFGVDKRFYDGEEYTLFPCLKKLADNHETIISEYLDDCDDSHDSNCSVKHYDWPEKYLYKKEKGHDWKVVPLYGFGIWNKQYNENFPETIKMLKEIPGLRTAIFSRLGPKTKLNKHQGWATLANEVLRCHMGIVVPDPGVNEETRSGIEVEDEFRQIKKGKWMVFDDSKMHIGVNDSDEIRVALLLDIERPWWVKDGRSKVKKTPELESVIVDFTK